MLCKFGRNNGKTRCCGLFLWEDEIMKTALLVVSFGTTHLDTLERNIQRIEEVFAAAFPEYPLYRAFTSGIVRKRLKTNLNVHVDSVEEALARIAADGFGRILVQPTLLIPGSEYDKLCGAIQSAAGTMDIRIGRPLLCSDGDMDTVIDLLQTAYPVGNDTALLFMGHGSEHSANDIYVRLAQKMLPFPMRLCTVEGTPTFEDGVASLASLPQKKVHMAPLMLVAGDHAKNDMAGEEPDTLRSLLEARGYEVTYSIQGLGELESIRNLYVSKAREVCW